MSRRRVALAVVLLGALCLGAFAAAADRKFDPKNFDPHATPGANEWFPLVPGLQSVRQGFVNVGHRRLPHRIVFTVTDVYRTIAGVRAVVVLDQDFDGGEISEQALDYFAEDRQGNVWYLGSYTESYEGGQYVNANDAWLAGVGGAVAGLMMPATPRKGTASYVQEQVPGKDTTIAQVTQSGKRVCVPFKCYVNVLALTENGSENKYFARGVGGIRTEPLSGNSQETEALINLRRLSPRGLSELSAEALKLDRHARSTAPDVFGRLAVAKRIP